MRKIQNLLKPNHKKIAIVGHVHPDGDCLGSTISAYRYLKDFFPDRDFDLYLEPFVSSFFYLSDDLKIREDDGEGMNYDFVISLDASTPERIGAGQAAFREAKETFSFDHHETNTGFANESFVVPDASSTCEVLYSWLSEERITKEIAEALYTGIIHDTGVFRHSCTSPETLRIAAKLLEKNLDFTTIIRNTITEDDYNVVRLTAEVIEKSRYDEEKQFLVSYAPISMQDKYGLKPLDLGGVIAGMNVVKKVSVVAFLYQVDDSTWKGSLRSNCNINVADIAGKFGGGGHAKASGFSLKGNPEEAVNEISKMISEQL